MLEYYYAGGDGRFCNIVAICKVGRNFLRIFFSRWYTDSGLIEVYTRGFFLPVLFVFCFEDFTYLYPVYFPVSCRRSNRNRMDSRKAKYCHQMFEETRIYDFVRFLVYLYFYRRETKYTACIRAAGIDSNRISYFYRCTLRIEKGDIV